MSNRFNAIFVGETLPERAFTASNVSLFLYNAAIWNAHRIHYDAPYTTEVEKHPAVVIDGPLQGDWMSQSVLNWLGDDGVLVKFQYTNRRASYLGETLKTIARVTAKDENAKTVTVELGVQNEAGDVIAPGSALVRFSS